MKNAMVTVRAASTRLPNKCFLGFGETNVLGHVISRCRATGFEPIVATTNDDRTIVEQCRSLDVRCTTGPTSDKLARWMQACDEFDVKSFVAVDCDDPFFDPILSTEMIQRIERSDSICSPDMRAYLGSAGWSMSASALRRACESKVTTDTEMIWKALPTTVQVESHDAHPSPIEDGLRLTLDYQEDYWLLSTVLRQLGPLCSRSQIVEFFQTHPGLMLINRFRNEEWKRRQNV